jgi:hypothetical protein
MALPLSSDARAGKKVVVWRWYEPAPTATVVNPGKYLDWLARSRQTQWLGRKPRDCVSASPLSTG